MQIARRMLRMATSAVSSESNSFLYVPRPVFIAPRGQRRTPSIGTAVRADSGAAAAPADNAGPFKSSDKGAAIAKAFAKAARGPRDDTGAAILSVRNAALCCTAWAEGSWSRLDAPCPPSSAHALATAHDIGASPHHRVK